MTPSPDLHRFQLGDDQATTSTFALVVLSHWNSLEKIGQLKTFNIGWWPKVDAQRR
jgi:hypothetical protein